METLKLEQERFLEYSQLYMENSSDVIVPPVQPGQPGQTKPGKSNTSTGKAKKTIQSRTTKFGKKTMSDPAYVAAKENLKDQPTK